MPTTYKAFQAFAKASRVGAEFIYHREGEPRDAMMFQFANDLYAGGEFFLCQRRNEDGVFDYLCVRSRAETMAKLDRISASVAARPEPEARRPATDYLGASYGVPASGRALMLDMI